MLEFIHAVRDKLLGEIVGVLDLIESQTSYLYEHITENLIFTLRAKFGVPRGVDIYPV